MTDYIELLQADWDRDVKPVFEEIQTNVREVALAKKRLAEEKALASRHDRQIDTLHALGMESLLSSKNDYEKFRTAIQQRLTACATSADIVNTLEQNILPRLQAEWHDLQRELGNKVHGFFASHKHLCEVRLRQHFDALVAERDAYFGAADALCHQVGTGFSRGRNSQIPRLEHPRLNKQRPDLVQGLDLEQRVALQAALKLAQPEPVTA